MQRYAKDLGEKTFKDIERYLEAHKDKLLSDVYYNEKTWLDFLEWQKENHLSNWEITVLKMF